MTKKLCDFKPFKTISGNRRSPFSIGLEITSRCNLNCRHCYINLAASDKAAKARELSLEDIDRIAEAALESGTLWFIITGGEPLLREDFPDIYLLLKKKGFLVSVLTNGTLISEKHIDLFKKYPPRSIEISTYGAYEKTCDAFTRTKNSFKLFQQGFKLCVHNGFDIILKTVAARAILPELAQVKAFAEQYDNVVVKVENTLISRVDENLDKTKQIREQRSLSALDHNRPGTCQNAGTPLKKTNDFGGNLFLCHAGINSCWISSDGMAHLCSTLRYPDFAYDLKKGSLKDYWNRKVPEILSITSKSDAFRADCGSCSDRENCEWCPALSWVETRKLDHRVEYICIQDRR